MTCMRAWVLTCRTECDTVSIMETVPVYTTEQVRLMACGRRRLFWLGLACALAVAANIAAGLIVFFERSF